MGEGDAVCTAPLVFAPLRARLVRLRGVYASPWARLRLRGLGLVSMANAVPVFYKHAFFEGNLGERISQQDVEVSSRIYILKANGLPCRLRSYC